MDKSDFMLYADECTVIYHATCYNVTEIEIRQKFRDLHDYRSFCGRYSRRGAVFSNGKKRLSEHQPGICEGQLIQDET